MFHAHIDIFYFFLLKQQKRYPPPAQADNDLTIFHDVNLVPMTGDTVLQNQTVMVDLNLGIET